MVLILGIGIFAVVAYGDIRTRRIPNELIVAILALAAFRIGYTWASVPEYAETVLTYNDFQYEDHTYEAKWPGETFFPFRFVKDVTPALYLGFSKKLPVDNIGIYFDVVGEQGETKGRQQKGQPRRAALFDASHNSAERRLRGLLETAEQRLNHLRVLLVSG